MKPLNTRYSNLIPLRFTNEGSNFRIEYSPLKQKVKAALTIIACLAVGFGVYLTVEDKFVVWFLAICVITAIGILILTVVVHHKEKNRSPFMIFDGGLGEARFPRKKETVKNAHADLSFSHERYQAVKGCKYELNYVVGERRHIFLSSVYSLKSIALELERKGFKVSYFDELEK